MSIDGDSQDIVNSLQSQKEDENKSQNSPNEEFTQNTNSNEIENENKIQESELDTQDILNDLSEKDFEFSGMAIQNQHNIIDNNNNNNNNNNNRSNDGINSMNSLVSTNSTNPRMRRMSRLRPSNVNNGNNSNNNMNSINHNSVDNIDNIDNINSIDDMIENMDNIDNGSDLLEEDFDIDSNNSDNIDSAMETSTAVYCLGVIWMNEKNCPEILLYEKDVIEKIQQIIKQRENYIDDKSDQLLENFEQNSQIDTGNPSNSKFEQHCLHLYKSELQRIRYMLNSYQRIRLWKIQEQCLFILQTPDMFERLTKEERIFCENYRKLMEKHYQRTFLSRLPEQFQSIADPEMIVKPNVNKHIILRVQDPIGNYIYDENKDVELTQSLIFIGKYKDFKELINDGAIDAI